MALGRARREAGRWTLDSMDAFLGATSGFPIARKNTGDALGGPHKPIHEGTRDRPWMSLAQDRESWASLEDEFASTTAKHFIGIGGCGSLTRSPGGGSCVRDDKVIS